MDYLTKAIRALVGSDDFAYSGEDYATIEWIIAPSTIPSVKQITDKISELRQADEATASAKAAQKEAILAKLGLTSDEVAALLA